MPSPSAQITPPVAAKKSKITETHGLRLVDNYFWLRDKNDPAVKAYLEAENEYTEAVMKSTEPLQQKLYGEMLSRIKETDIEVPYRYGAHFYYSRTETGMQYPIRCRRKGSVETPEEIVLDLNELARGQSFMAVAAYQVSDDGNLLAYSTDNTGFRQYTLAIKDLHTGELFPERIEKTGSVAWAKDNRTIYYTVEDSSKRQYRLYRHTLGASGADELVYEEPDERFNVDVFRTRSKAFIFLITASHTTSEARYIPADQPRAEWKLIEPRRQDIEYYPDHNGESFYIRANDRGRNFRLVRAPVDSPQSANWEEVIAHRDNVMLDDAEFFKNHYVLHEREHGLPQISIALLDGDGARRIDFPEPAYLVSPYVNREYDTTKYRYAYQSFITPLSIFEHDVFSGNSTLLKEKEVPGGFDRTLYQVEQLYAPAADGIKVPISVTYLKGTRLDGSAPLYLYAYGSYGHSVDISFNSNIFSLVDRGIVYAVAHPRGGGEMGKSWHDDGRMMRKKNTFTDFIACAEYLVGGGYGSKEKLVIEGASAGGLLMGAVANMRPELFHAVIAKVPFVDVINSMLDESLPLTVGEFEEWGNPKEKAAFDYMLSYSPYDNIEDKPYPAMLVKTSFNDSQVMYWEPAKYVAKMRAMCSDQNLLLLKTNMGAGHGGASGRYDRLHEIAFDYAFVLSQVGIGA
jgi:oligopeptidase B